MKQLSSRILSFVLLLLFFAGFLLVAFLGFPSEKWSLLWEDFRAGLPVVVWLILLIFILSIGIAYWSELLIRNSAREAGQILESLALNEELPTSSIEGTTLSPHLKQSLENVRQLLHSQRSSLARLSNERAETKEKLIQERLVAERQRLARELHDSVSQQLFAASMLLSAITEGKEAPPPMLLQTEKMVQQAQLEMRALLLHLRPAALHDKSLRQGLYELLTELKEKVYFKIDFKLEEVPLSKGAEDHLFRIAQETLSNTLRHSKATEVHVLFVERDGLAILRIQDNGIGFESDQTKSTSYGLKHIEERAIEIGAVSKIVSVPSEGTIVEVKLATERTKNDDPNSAR